MAIDTKNERLSILAWPDGTTLPEPDGAIALDDRRIIIGLPSVDDVMAPSTTARRIISTGVHVGI